MGQACGSASSNLKTMDGNTQNKMIKNTRKKCDYKKQRSIDNAHSGNSTNISNMDNNKLIVKHKPNLIRPNTDSPWNDSDIEEMEDEMEYQLLTLKLKNSKEDVCKIGLGDNERDKQRRDSITNICRQQSIEKWDNEEVQETMNDMQRQLNYLQTTQKITNQES